MAKIRFTFHYASTLSTFKIADVAPLTDLHSIMLLLYLLQSLKVRFQLIPIYIPLCFYFIQTMLSEEEKQILIYIPLCFYFINKQQKSGRVCLSNLHSIMLLLYPVSFFSPYFLLFRPIFCPPSFLFIFPLQKHPCQISKMQFYLGSSSFVYLLEILHYFKSTIRESCSFYHHPHPRTL